MEKNDRIKALIEARRVLHMDGRIILTVPAHQCLYNAHDVFLEHKLRYSKKQLKQELKKAGLDKHKLRYWNSILMPLLIGWKLKNRAGSGSDFIRVPKWLNALLYYTLKLEERIRLPWGLTILGVAEK